jgi:hypothetical protein
MKQEHLKMMAAETARGLEKYRRSQERLAKRQGPPAPGDMYRSPTTTDADTRWLVTGIHPRNNELLFIVPFDNHFLAGSADVELPREATLGPLIVRSRYGMWIDRTSLERGTRVAVLEGEFLNLVNNKLDELAAGRVVASDEQEEADEDPDYLDWCDEVASCRELWQAEDGVRAEERMIAAWAIQEPVLLSLKKFVVAQNVSPVDLSALAAANASMSEDLTILASSDVASSRTCRLETDLPGELEMALESAGIRLYYAPRATEGPPLAQGINAAGEPVAIEWIASPKGDGYRAQVAVPWRDETITVTLLAEPKKTYVIRDEQDPA